jgi:hypothetical protein
VARSDLTSFFAALRIERRPGTYTYVAVDETAMGAGVDALIREAEGVTAVVTVDEGRTRGWVVGIELVWLTVAVETSLDAVGITAALSGALAEQGIAANVLAALHHDHVLVPVAEAERAVAILEGLRSAP